MPTAMRGRDGRQLGHPGVAHRVEAAQVANARSCPRLPLVQGFQFALQRPLVHVAEDRVIDLDDRRQRALAEAGDGAQGGVAVGGGERTSGPSRRLRAACSPRLIITFSSRSRDPRVWQAVPRQTQTVLRPCGSRLNSA